MTKTLIITFKTEDNKSFRVSIRNPKEGITKVQVEPIAQKIIATKIFNTAKRELKTLKKVSYISRDENIVEA